MHEHMNTLTQVEDLLQQLITVSEDTTAKDAKGGPPTSDVDVEDLRRQLAAMQV